MTWFCRRGNHIIMYGTICLTNGRYEVRVAGKENEGKLWGECEVLASLDTLEEAQQYLEIVMRMEGETE